MKVLVTGANGFVGSALCREALRRGHECLALVRPASSRSLVPARATEVHGDFTNGAVMADILGERQPDAIIHAGAVVSNGRPNLERAWRVNVEGTRSLLRAAEGAGVQRWVQISSMSAHPANRSVYGGTKLACDAVVRSGAIDWTILRPSLVYGPGQRGIFHRMRTMIRQLPVVPLLGSGSEPMRPVHVDDVAWAALEALERPGAVRGTYCLGGPEDWTFRTLVGKLASAEGRRPMLLPIPMPLCRVGALLGEVLLEDTPVSTDNLEGITSAQPVDITAAESDLGFVPRAFCG
jgi:NADH dehydrogenase